MAKKIVCSTCSKPKIEPSSYNKMRFLADQPLFCSDKCRKASKSSITAKCDGCGKKFTTTTNLTDLTYAIRNDEPVYCSSACSKPLNYRCTSCKKASVATKKNYNYIAARIRDKKSVNCPDCAHLRGDSMSTTDLIAIAENVGLKVKLLDKKQSHKSSVKRCALYKGSTLIMEGQVSIAAKYVAGFAAGYDKGFGEAVKAMKKKKKKTIKAVKRKKGIMKKRRSA